MSFVYKIIRKSDEAEILKTGFIPDQVADVGCEYIHACDIDSVRAIVERFFKDQESVVLKISLERVGREGFTIKYESGRSGTTKYWHFYRPDGSPNKLLSHLCIIGKL